MKGDKEKTHARLIAKAKARGEQDGGNGYWWEWRADEAGWWWWAIIDDDDDINANKRRCWSILEMHKQIGQNLTKKKYAQKLSSNARTA